jgi:hypothetical protein
MNKNFEYDYIHSQKCTESVQNSLSAQSFQSCSGEKITKIPMNIVEEYKEHIFGIDRINCSIPTVDMASGEIIVDVEQIKKRLKSMSFIQSDFKKDLVDQAPNPFEDISEDEFDIELEEINHYEKLVGTFGKLPVKVTIKNDILTLDFILANIVYGHNANPTEISQIEQLCGIVSRYVGIDIMSAYVNQVEYAFGIKTNQSLSSILDSLGSLGNSEKYIAPYGIRWTNIGYSSSLQVYSTNLKNKLKSSQGLAKRSKELESLEKKGYDMIRIENRRRYGFRNDVLTTLPFLSSLFDPNFILQELMLIRSLFGKIIKNKSKLCVETLEEVDIYKLMSEIKCPSELTKLIMAIGWAVSQDIMRNGYEDIKMRNKYRLNHVYESCEANMLDIIKNYSIPQHFHDRALEVIEHYIATFEEAT